MKLQVNYHGAWKNTPRILDGDDLPLDTLHHEYPEAKALRIIDGHDVLWYWKPESGWYRPHWYQAEERSKA